MGCHEAALSVRQEVISLYHTPNVDGQEQKWCLSHALYYYGITLSDMGHHEDALSVRQEAVSLYHTLDIDGQEQKQHLANALHDYGNTLSNLGCHEDALSIRWEAISLDHTLNADPVNHHHSSNTSSPLPTSQTPTPPAVIQDDSM